MQNISYVDLGTSGIQDFPFADLIAFGVGMGGDLRSQYADLVG